MLPEIAAQPSGKEKNDTKLFYEQLRRVSHLMSPGVLNMCLDMTSEDSNGAYSLDTFHQNLRNAVDDHFHRNKCSDESFRSLCLLMRQVEVGTFEKTTETLTALYKQLSNSASNFIDPGALARTISKLLAIIFNIDIAQYIDTAYETATTLVTKTGYLRTLDLIIVFIGKILSLLRGSKMTVDDFHAQLAFEAKVTETLTIHFNGTKSSAMTNYAIDAATARDRQVQDQLKALTTKALTIGAGRLAVKGATKLPPRSGTYASTIPAVVSPSIPTITPSEEKNPSSLIAQSRSAFKGICWDLIMHKTCTKSTCTFSHDMPTVSDELYQVKKQDIERVIANRKTKADAVASRK